MYAFNLEGAQRGACELLNWSHLVLKVAHGEGGPGVAPKTLQQIATNIRELAKRIGSVSPLLDSVATVTSIAGLTGANLHDVALSLANQVQKAAWKVLVEAQWRTGPNGSYVEKRPEFSDVNDYWPRVRQELQQIADFDCDSACRLVLRRSGSRRRCFFVERERWALEFTAATLVSDANAVRRSVSRRCHPVSGYRLSFVACEFVASAPISQ